MMKKVVLLLVMGLMTLLPCSAQSNNGPGEQSGDFPHLCVLYVHLKDGSKVQFMLPVQKPVVSCGRGLMKIFYQEDDGEKYMTFKRDLVEDLTFGTADANAIDEQKADNALRVTFDLTRDGIVRASGLLPSDHLQVFSIDGKSVNAIVNRNDRGATIDLTQKPRGIYVVSINKCLTFKLMKP
jgi:hypothetical protein